MRKFKTCRLRALPVRSLLAAAGALLLMAALAPRANADVIAYFNFEDGTLGGVPDFQSDFTFAPDNNPGGGVVDTILTSTYNPGDFRSGVGVTQNRTPRDIDTGGPGGLGAGWVLTSTRANNGFHFDILVTPNTQGLFFKDMTLSFAVASAGNGFTDAIFQYNIGAGFVTFFTSPSIAPNAITLLTAAIPAAANNASQLTLRVMMTGGTSSGNNLETVIDNIRVDGTIVPEPTTVAGGLLGVLGLCWHQRRRLRFLLPRSRRT